MSESSLIVRSFNAVEVRQRRPDGYFDATAMCRASRRLWADYWRLASTQEFVAALAADMGIPISALVESRRGGSPGEQGTWAHPDVAVHLAQWCSPAFAVRVSRWVRELLTSGAVELAGRERPWMARFDQCLLDFQRSVLTRCGPGWWAVLTALPGHAYALEDELLRQGLPVSGTDLFDGSVGRRYVNHRKGEPWAGPVSNAAELRHNGLLVAPNAYSPPERPHFERWLFGTYLPECLPDYLTSKFRGHGDRPLLAADAACRRLTGRPAALPRSALRRLGRLGG